MKFLLSLNLMFFLMFLGNPIESSEAACPVVEEEEALTILTQICHFSYSTGGNASCAAGAVHLTVDNTCVGKADAMVQVVNLHPSPVQGQTYSLPTGMPDIYYEYTPDGEATKLIGPINSFTFEGRSEEGANGRRYPFFEFHSEMSMDVSQECASGDIVDKEVHVRLLDGAGELYPIELFAGSSDVFCCEIFLETCNECSSPPSGCTGSGEPAYDITACGECSSNCVNTRSETEDNTSFITIPSKEELPLFKVEPNPFVNRLTIAYSLEEASNVSLDILDVKGKIVHQFNTFEEEGEYSLSVNTDNFSNGIYFCRMKINSAVLTEKLIKLK